MITENSTPIGSPKTQIPDSSPRNTVQSNQEKLDQFGQRETELEKGNTETPNPISAKPITDAARIKALNRQLKAKNTELEESKQTTTRYWELLDIANKEKIAALEDLAATQKTIQDLNKQVTETDHKYALKVLEVENKEGQLETIQNELTAAQKTIHELEEQVKETNHQYTLKTKEVESKERQITLIQESYQKATQQLTQAKDKLKDLEKQPDQESTRSSNGESSSSDSDEQSDDEAVAKPNYANLSKRTLIQKLNKRDNYIQELIQEQDASFDIIEKKNGHITNLKHQLKTNLEENKDQLDKIIELTAEKKKLKKQLQNQNPNIKPSSSEPKSNETKVKMNILMDSNRKHVRPHLKDTNEIKYNFITTTYTTDDLADKVNEFCSNHQPGDQYTIMLGTNNLKLIANETSEEEKNQITKETYDNIKSSVIQMRQQTDALIHIIKIPPHQNNDEINQKIMSVNDSLVKLQNRDAGINVIEAFATEAYEAGTDRTEVIQDDGIHLTREGGKVVVDCMKHNETIAKQHIDHTRQP